MTAIHKNDLLIATTNQGKLRELTQLLSGLPLQLRQLSDFHELPVVEETGRSFAENAQLKAVEYSRLTRLWTLADDSGLEVDALGGAPGVLSARYYGAAASDQLRNARLLEDLRQTNDASRAARFICVIAMHKPGESSTHLFTGECRGSISAEPRGHNGFGYDPLFIPNDYDNTFGELSDEVKKELSHRGRALAQVRDHLAVSLTSSA